MSYLFQIREPKASNYDYNGIKFTETLFHRVHSGYTHRTFIKLFCHYFPYFIWYTLILSINLQYLNKH